MKRYIAGLLLFLSFSALVAEKFRISDVSYVINGITRKYAIENAVEISTSRIFNSYDELHAYIRDIEQQFQNERTFATSSVNLTYDFSDSGGVTLIHLRIFTSDSKHFLLVPYPKYSSNDGLTIKLKMKDTNFLGTMSALNFDVNFAMEKEDDDADDDYSYSFGVNFSYDYPFKLGPLKSSWNNSFGIDYTIGEKAPEFDASTGFTFELPFDLFSICLNITQSISRDFDYEEFDDDLYYTEEAKLSVPIILAKIDNWGNVTWSPYTSVSFYWDSDGIHKDNEDLTSPTIEFGHDLSTARINWIGNFREGLAVSAGQSVSYNVETDTYSPKVWAEIAGYKAFKYAGITGRLYSFASYKSTEKIGSRLRGIRDDQEYDDFKKKALSVPVAVVGNFDLPVHIFTTNWQGMFAFIFGEDSKIANAFSFVRYFDFELQLSIFGDFALTQNYATGKLLSIKDGFYAGGVEMILYPEKWRSLEVRASLGIDAGRKIIKKAVSSLIDTSWRKNVAPYEIYVGIGLHY